MLCPVANNVQDNDDAHTGLPASKATWECREYVRHIAPDMVIAFEDEFVMVGDAFVHD